MHDPIARTIAILRAGAPRWGELVESADRELLARQPEPGEWSALECLGHAADTEASIFGRRVRSIRDGEPALTSFDPDREGTPITAATDPTELVRKHAAGRVENLALLGSLVEADLDKTSVHPDYGPVSLRQLLNEWSAHELMHLVQAERAIMQAFIPGSGPWRPFFADHDVEARGAATRA